MKGIRSKTPIFSESGSTLDILLILPDIKSCGINQPAFTTAGIKPIRKGESVSVAAKTGMMVLIDQKLSEK